MMFTTCASCGADILFANSAATGKRMPIDAGPVEGGNIRLEPRPRPLPPLAHVIGPTLDLFNSDDDGTRYVSHFATCPNAATWRARGRPMSAEQLATPGPTRHRTMHR